MSSSSNIKALLKDKTPLTDFIKNRIPVPSENWSTIGTGLHILAGFTDLYPVGVVTYGGIAGAGLKAALIATGLPEVPIATGWAGAAIAELAVQPVLRVGNILATFATISTYFSETKAGSTIIETGQISPTTSNSVILTISSWVVPQEAFISATFQTAAILNDFRIIYVPFPH